MFKSTQQQAARPVRPERIDTIVGKDSEFKGVIEVQGALRVEGRVEGEIRGVGDVTVGEGAVVHARIQGRNVIIAGTVKGDVDASGRLELAPTGRLEGDIAVSTLLIACGATFVGTSTMKGAAAMTGSPASPPTDHDGA
ncbi:MAG: polymer-forming cytoskeletal protein [Bacillota bacterium]